MNYFLTKTEPSAYSIDRLASERQAVWDGITNPAAVKTLRSMRPGDRVFIYHSGATPAVVGLAKVVSEPRDDPKNSRSALVDFEFVSKLESPVTLAEIKESELFVDWALVRQGRLSTMPAPASFVEWMRKRFPAAGI